MRITWSDLKDAGILKYYRVVRKWARRTYGLKEADIELLIYLDSLNYFTRKQFMQGEYIYSWDKHRWERLRREGWIMCGESVIEETLSMRFILHHLSANK